jgi:hypothetical protein
MDSNTVLGFAKKNTLRWKTKYTKKKNYGSNYCETDFSEIYATTH